MSNTMAAKLDTSFIEQLRLVDELSSQQEFFSSLVSNIPGILFRVSPPPERRVHFLSVCSEPGAGSTFEIYLPAVKLFRAFAERIDLVLLDMMMPVMSGREAFLELRRIKPQVKVLLSSGFRADTRVQELIDGGVAGFIDKPYSLRSLAQAVGEILAGGSRA